jgi:hypothetical protein
MPAKDYVDPKGYWIDAERNIRRMSGEDGKQEVVLKATDNCSDAEWLLFVALFVEMSRS